MERPSSDFRLKPEMEDDLGRGVNAFARPSARITLVLLDAVLRAYSTDAAAR